jgi:hypothetical protein
MLGFLGIFTGLLFAAIIYYFARQNQESVTLAQFIYPFGRKPEIDFLVSRIKTGQSSAVIGLFSNEKTEILGSLTNNALYEEQAESLIFSNVDIALRANYTSTQFWEWAMQPLQDVPEVTQAYEVCLQNQFNDASLRRLINVLHQSGKRLVLLLNNFQEVLHYSQLKQDEFFATLRSLASSRHPSPLAVVVAINQSLMDFHRETEKLNPSGSPYLNFMEGGITILKGLSDSEVDALLAEVSPPLSDQAKQLVKKFAGGSPYLLQVATSEFLKGKEPLEEFESNFFRRMELSIERMLQGWSPSRCQALLTVIQKAKVVGFEKELGELAAQGFIEEKAQWQLRAEIFRKIVESKPQHGWCQQLVKD